MSEKTVLVAVKVTAPEDESLPDDDTVARYVNDAVAGDRLQITEARNGTGDSTYWEIAGAEAGAAAPS